MENMRNTVDSDRVWRALKKFPMQPEQNAEREHATVSVPKTKLTTALQTLQGMFPNLNTAIIDRAILTSNGDVNVALEKLLQVSSKFS